MKEESLSTSTHDVSIKPKKKRTVKNIQQCMFTYIDVLFKIISVKDPNIE